LQGNRFTSICWWPARGERKGEKLGKGEGEVRERVGVSTARNALRDGFHPLLFVLLRLGLEHQLLRAIPLLQSEYIFFIWKRIVS